MGDIWILGRLRWLAMIVTATEEDRRRLRGLLLEERIIVSDLIGPFDGWIYTPQDEPGPLDIIFDLSSARR